MNHPKHLYRTWIEINTQKLRHNMTEFLKYIPKKTELMAVVKSNAYGHGIVGIAQTLSLFPRFQKRGWFGVDSLVEGIRLRKDGIIAPILVLGFTLPNRMQEAAKHNIAITISTLESLKILQTIKNIPKTHLKFDTGMHRQGFFKKDLPAVLEVLKKIPNVRLKGVYTHFALAKDPEDYTFTHQQYSDFQEVVGVIKKKYPNILCHAAATGGALLFPQTHADMVRIGIGLYGYFPSLEAKTHLQKKVFLQPILSWKSIISEIKKVQKGLGVGYDLTCRVSRNTTIAVIPIGYWHGYDRGLSSCGLVLVRGKRARVLGRVSMDMIIVDITDIPKVSIGDTVTIIGSQGKETITAEEIADMLGTSAYEVLTRINPLIYKINI